jgi:hypothetical protein
MRARRIGALETSGADSSGLTEALPRFITQIPVRLSEQHVVVLTLCLHPLSLFERNDARYARTASLLDIQSWPETQSLSICYPEPDGEPW